MSKNIAFGESGFFTVNLNSFKVSSSVDGSPLSVYLFIGNPNPSSENNKDFNCVGDVSIKAAGNINIEATGNLALAGARIDLN